MHQRKSVTYGSQKMKKGIIEKSPVSSMIVI
jgi:hypothetical protein